MKRFKEVIALESAGRIRKGAMYLVVSDTKGSGVRLLGCADRFEANQFLPASAENV